MIKNFFFDLDGTLMHMASKISRLSWEAIDKIQSNNYNVIIATGRDLRGVAPLMDKINTRYYIFNNGALIYDYYNKKRLYEKFLNMSIFKKYESELILDSSYLVIYAKEGVFITRKNFYIQFLFKLHFYNIKKITDWKYIEKLSIYKILVLPRKSKLAQYREIIKKMKKDFELVKVPWGYNLNAKGINKGFGISILSKITKENYKKNACYFGDGFNDISVRNYINFLVATKNARKELKQESDVILKESAKKQILEGVEIIFEKNMNYK